LQSSKAQQLDWNILLMDHLLHFILHKAVAAECTHYGVMEHGLVWGDVAMGDPSRCRDPG